MNKHPRMRPAKPKQSGKFGHYFVKTTKRRRIDAKPTSARNARRLERKQDKT